jgi:hypothetical protein
MKIIRTRLSLAVATALAASLPLAATVPASASPRAVSQEQVLTPKNVLLNPFDNTTSPFLYLVTHGLGNQVDIEEGGTKFNFVLAGSGGVAYKIEVSNDTTHCLTKSGTDLITALCAPGDGSQIWTWNWNSDSNSEFALQGTGVYFGVFNPNVDTKPVYVEGKRTGYYVGWYVLSNGVVITGG